MQLEQDLLSAFMFEDGHIRGQIIHLNNSLATLLQKHDYPEAIENLLAEAITCLLLMNGIIKYQGQMTLQFRAKGPLSLLLVKCNHLREFRAYADFDRSVALTSDMLKEQLGDGQLVLTIEQDNQVKPYQSIVPMVDGDLSLSLEHYFSQSEQLPTKLWIASKNREAAGLLIQQMPDKGDSKEREDFWQTASILGESVSDDELLSLDSQTLLFRLYHEQGVRLFSPVPVQFKCPCSKEKMSECLKVLGYDDVKDLLKSEEVVDVGCQFCQTHYHFDSIDVEVIFQHLK
jgi:molecular chaperone Hsp33